jgi:hypothetical protein
MYAVFCGEGHDLRECWRSLYSLTWMGPGYDRRYLLYTLSDLYKDNGFPGVQGTGSK